MALQVWLPLNGNLNNYGADGSVSNIPYTAASFANGKTGKNLVISNAKSTSVTFTSLVGLKEFTISYWYKFTSGNTFTTYADLIWLGCSSGTLRLETCNTTGGSSKWYGNGMDSNGTVSHSVVLNTWYHDCIVVTGSTITRYINGKSIGTVTKPTTNIALTGAFSLGDAGMYGGLADVRIYDECLSVKQIKELSKGLVAHYKLEGTQGGENLILASHQVTSGGQGSGITRTYEKDGSLKVVSESGNGNYCSLGFAKNSNTNVGEKMAVGDKYTISCDIKVETGTTFPTLFINGGNGYKALRGDISKIGEWQRVYYTSIWAEPGTNYGNISLHLGFGGAIGTYYFKNFKLEKGDILTKWTPAPSDDLYHTLGYDKWINIDSSGYGYDTITAGNIYYHADSPRYEGSTQFNGVNTNYIYRSKFDWLKPPFTFNCWCNQVSRTSQKGSSGTTTLQFVESQGRDCGLAGFSLVLSNGVPKLFLGTETEGTYHQINSDTALTLNTWHMLTGTYDGTTVKLYVDGILKASKAVTTAISWAQADGFVIGKMAYRHTTTTNYFPFNGYINDVRVYSTALDVNDVLALYNNSAYIDNYGNIGAYEFIEED